MKIRLCHFLTIIVIALLPALGALGNDAPAPLSEAETIGLTLLATADAPAPGVYLLANPTANAFLRRALIHQRPPYASGAIMGVVAEAGDLPWLQQQLAGAPNGEQQAALFAALAGMSVRQIPGAAEALAPWGVLQGPEVALARARQLWAAGAVAPTDEARQEWARVGNLWLKREASDRLGILPTVAQAPVGPRRLPVPATLSRDKGNADLPALATADTVRSWYYDDGFSLRAAGAEITQGNFTFGFSQATYDTMWDATYWSRTRWLYDDSWDNSRIYGIWRFGGREW